MENEDTWYDDISEISEKYRFIFSMSNPEKNPVNVMLRVSKRIAEFSGECETCQEFKSTIEQITQSFNTIEKLPHERRKRPFKKLKPIIRHLQKGHHLAAENQYAVAGLVIGLVGGAFLGFIGGKIVGNLGNGIAIGMIAGLFIGMKFGYSMDEKQKAEGKAI